VAGKKEHKMNYLIRQPVVVVVLLIGFTTTGNTQQSWDRASAGPDYNPSSKPTEMAAAAPVKVHVEQSQVRLLRNGKTIAVCRTQLPEIENWKLINGNRQIVVKSRGRHGPAAVELFNVVDGSLADKVMAFAIRNGKPEWARGFEE
jgi:hypothetical protein